MSSDARGPFPWLPFVPLVAALVGAGTAAAQMEVREDDEAAVGDTYGGAGGSWVEGRSSGGVRLAGSLGPRTVPEVHTVRRGDTLWDITGHYLGNPWEWPRIWSYNPDITNPHWIYPGDRVRLKGSGEGAGRLPGAEGAEGADADGTEIRVVQPEPPSSSIQLEDQGYLDRHALETAGVIVGSPEEHMLLSTYDEVYVEFENGGEVKPGKEYTIFRRMREDERLDDEEGVLVRIFGALQIRAYDPDEQMARAVIIDALDPIERGYRVADMPRRFRMVPPVRNEKTVESEVVAALRPRSLLADYQVVFVDAGAEDGVELGNRFFILQRGDQWRKSLTVSEESMGAELPEAEEGEDYPDEVVAEGRVVDVQQSSSALLVTRSLSEIGIGDRAEMRKGF